MKYILLSLLLIGCASHSTKKSGGESEMKQPEKKVEAAVKEEAKKAVKKEMKAATKVASKAKTNCSYGENERVIENRTADAGGCEVVYTKDGNPDIVANAQNELDYCQQVADRIVGKLVDAGFKCE